jgi:hypothetical protein
MVTLSVSIRIFHEVPSRTSVVDQYPFTGIGPFGLCTTADQLPVLNLSASPIIATFSSLDGSW